VLSITTIDSLTVGSFGADAVVVGRDAGVCLAEGGVHLTVVVVCSVVRATNGIIVFAAVIVAHTRRSILRINNTSLR